MTRAHEAFATYCVDNCAKARAHTARQFGCPPSELDDAVQTILADLLTKPPAAWPVLAWFIKRLDGEFRDERWARDHALGMPIDELATDENGPSASNWGVANATRSLFDAGQPQYSLESIPEGLHRCDCCGKVVRHVLMNWGARVKRYTLPGGKLGASIGARFVGKFEKMHESWSWDIRTTEVRHTCAPNRVRLYGLVSKRREEREAAEDAAREAAYIAEHGEHRRTTDNRAARIKQRVAVGKPADGKAAQKAPRRPKKTIQEKAATAAAKRERYVAARAAKRLRDKIKAGAPLDGRRRQSPADAASAPLKPWVWGDPT